MFIEVNKRIRGENPPLVSYLCLVAHHPCVARLLAVTFVLPEYEVMLGRLLLNVKSRWLELGSHDYY